MTRTLLRMGAPFLSLAIAHGAMAASTITGLTTGAPTAGLSTHLSYTLTATSDQGRILGFNFSDRGSSGFGFYGPFNQLFPFGLPSPFGIVDNPAADPPSNANPADTHFLVKTTDGIAIAADDSATFLVGAYNLSNPASGTSSMPLAQLVMPMGQTATFRGQITVATPTGNILENVSGVVGVPEPATAALLALACAGLMLGRRSER